MIKIKKDKQTLLNISKQRQKKGDIIGAISILHSDKPYSKDNLELYYQKALIYIEQKNFNSAIDCLLLFAQLGNNKQKCKAFNAIGYSFLQKKNHLLADAFYNLQLDISVKQRCDFDDQMYEHFYKQDNKTKFKKVFPYEEEFKDAVLVFELEEFDKALETFNLIPSTSNYYQEVLFYKAKIFFRQKQYKKAIAYFQEYDNITKDIPIYNYYEIISLLAEKDMQEYNYYLNNLLNQKSFQGRDNLLVADLVFKLTDNYDLVLEYLDEYEKQVKISPVSLSLRGLAYLYSNNIDKAKEYIKKAYLYSNLSKFKHMLKDMSKEAFIMYPTNLVVEYTNYLHKQINKQKISKVNYSTLKDIFEIAIDINKKEFWQLLLDYLEKIRFKTASFYLKYLLIIPEVELYIKVRAKRILATNGFIGSLIEFGKIPTRAPFIKLDKFKTDKFKESFIGAYTALFILTNPIYVRKALGLEEKIQDKIQDFTTKELSAMLMCYLLKDRLRAKSYKDLFGVSKGRIREILKLLNIKI